MTRGIFLSTLLGSFLLLAAPPTVRSHGDEQAPKLIEKLGSGDHYRTIRVDDLDRSYLVHIPKSYDPAKPTPIVLALHAAAMNGPAMVAFSGLNKKSDEAGFIVVYPSGTGRGPFLTWNAGGLPPKMLEKKPNDVTFLNKMLDELSTLVNVDTKRVYACGMSNGGMMCYRLAAEMSDRIAAIAPVAGTIAIDNSKPVRPVPVIHFHGTKDTFVPFKFNRETAPSFMRILGAEDSVQTWVKLNDCQTPPTSDILCEGGKDLKVTRTLYGGGKQGSEVVLVVVEEGGHTWPGQRPPMKFVGKTTLSVSANDLLWEFFQKHTLN